MNKAANTYLNSNRLSEVEAIKFRNRLADEPDWLYDLRHKGWSYYDDPPPPSRVIHLWRYSDPKHFAIGSAPELMNLFPADGRGKHGEFQEIDPQLAGYGRNFADRSSVFALRPEYRKLKIIFDELSRSCQDYPQIASQ